jgi:hypothetical protein
VPLAWELHSDIQRLWWNSGDRWRDSHGKAARCDFIRSFYEELGDWDKRYGLVPKSVFKKLTPMQLDNEAYTLTAPDSSRNTWGSQGMPPPPTQNHSYVTSNYTGNGHSSFLDAANIVRVLPSASATGRLDRPATASQCKYSEGPWWIPRPPCLTGQPLVWELEKEIHPLEEYFIRKHDNDSLFGWHDENGRSFAEASFYTASTAVPSACYNLDTASLHNLSIFPLIQ